MAWYDEASHTLKYAKRGTNGTWGSAATVDSSSGAGQFVSLAVDSANHPGIAYYDANRGDLKYAYFNGSSWSVRTVDSGNTVGYYPSLQFGGFDVPFISYYYKTGGDLRIAGLGNNGWEISTVANKGDVGRSLYGACKTEGFLFDLEIIIRAGKAGARIAEFPVTWSCDPDSRLRAGRTTVRTIQELKDIKRTMR